jgi:NAD(P)-dependent dehydrogenase (short-subunit alcohol dehydrogenase family)
MEKFNGKNVVVTGGSSGIGLATAKKFVTQGAKVLITGRDRSTVEAAARQSGAVGIVADQSTHDGIMHLVSAATTGNARIDVLFINAGIFQMASLADMTERHFDDVMGINVRGALFTLKSFVPHIADGASVIFLSSIVAGAAMANTAVYSASKAALNALARVAAVELAERTIRVNIVSPGPVDTPLWTKVGMSPQQVAEMGAAIGSRIPLKKFGAPEEIADTVLFLASPQASFITGSEVVVSGGYHLHTLA